MKRKIYLSVCLVLLIFSLCFSLTSCKTSDTDTAHPSAPDTPSSNKDGSTDIEDKTPEDTQPLDHYHLYELMILEPPSCGVEGRQAYICLICGVQQLESIIPALAHDYEYSSLLSSNATCTEDGKKVYYCTKCGITQEETFEATGHTWRVKTTCDSNTNELVFTPYCSKCSLVAIHEFRYKINDVCKLIEINNQFSEYGGHRTVNGIIVEYYHQAPYYRVYCDSTYLLIVRSDKPISYYKDEWYRECTVVL